MKKLLAAVALMIAFAASASAQNLNQQIYDSQKSYEFAAAVTPSNTVDFSFKSRALYIGGAGDVKVDMDKSGTVTFKAVPAGTVLFVRVKRVYATGTTATDIIDLF